MPAALPRLYRGHVIGFVVFVASGLTIGASQYAFGEFVAPLRAEFGWSQTQINLALSFALVSTLGAPLLGRAADRWGTRPVVFLSILAVGISFALRPLITELWHLYLFSALVYLGFPGSTILAVGKLVPLWYPATVGRATGAVTSGNNFGGLTMPGLAAFVIVASGWRSAYLVYGLIGIAVALFSLLVVTEDPPAISRAMLASRRGHLAARSASTSSHGLSLGQALRLRRFWLMLLGLAAVSFTYQGILTQLRQHFEEIGLAPSQATMALALIAALGVGSKLAFGRASERITARWGTVISAALQTIGVILLALAQRTSTAWIGIVVFGMGFGGLGALLVLVVQEFVGMKHFGTVMGAVQTTWVLPFAGGPLLAGMIHDVTGDYRLAFLIIAALFVVGAMLLMAAGPEAATAPTRRAQPGAAE